MHILEFVNLNILKFRILQVFENQKKKKHSEKSIFQPKTRKKIF